MSAVGKDIRFEFALRMGDTCLVLAQQLSAWCGKAPVLEEDIALANTALDLIGQAKFWLEYAGEREGNGRSADDLAFLRGSREYRNHLLAERPNGDYGQTLMRQFLFDAWHYQMLTALMGSKEQAFAEIAEKAIKEVRYHLDRSTDLIIRLGDGSEESHEKMQAALIELWPYVNELTASDAIDEQLASDGFAPDLQTIDTSFKAYLDDTFAEATLSIPENSSVKTGGKVGLHGEGHGFLLAEMQTLQRTYPDARW